MKRTTVCHAWRQARLTVELRTRKVDGGLSVKDQMQMCSFMFYRKDFLKWL